MTVIGITGGSGAGKGLVCEILEKQGIHSIDTDRVSREISGRGSPCLVELTQAFGTDILTEAGELNRGKLAERVFMEPNAEERVRLLDILNRITHKHILSACEAWLEERGREGDTAAAVDAPLLFESGFDARCDCIWGVTASPEVRIQRIIQRDCISEEMARNRIASQHTDEFLYQRCNAVIHNNGTRAETEKQVVSLLARCLNRA